MSSRQEKIDSLRHYTDLIQKQTGRVVRPYRYDGYVNMLNKYGTSRDVSERYEYKQEPPVPDDELTMYYEGNGLFSKIIDAPAEEAIKHGFELEGLKDQELEDFYKEALDELDWEETVMTAVKWARLFGGSIAVMMINDGRGIDEPLDWRNIRSIDDIRVYDRSLIQPDYSGMFSYNPDDPFGTRGSRLGMPEYYDVYSRYGQFRVHDSRCLVFQNGILPENSSNSVYQLWGMPEYIRLRRAMRDAEIAHGTAPKMLDRSIQAVYSMKDLAAELATEEGEDRVLRRLQTIDMARGLLNSITIDSEGEDYSFRQFSFTGVSEVIDTTCNFLSALTSIPQTILFGRAPAGMNATGYSDLENWYSYVERIQKRMVRKNLRYLLSIIFQAGVETGEIDEVPPINVKFSPLWSLSEQEEASLEQMKASTENVRANTAMVYVQMQALDPSEVRQKLADSEEFDVESLLDEYSEEELEENDPVKKAQEQQGGMPGMEGMGGMPGMGGAPGGMPGAPAPEGMPGGAPPEGGTPKEGGHPAEGEKPAVGGKPQAEGKAQPAPEGIKPEASSAKEPEPVKPEATAMKMPETAKTEALPKKMPQPMEGQGGKPKDTDLGGNAPAAAPAATKLPVDMSGKEKAKAKEAEENNQDEEPVGDTLRAAWHGITPTEEAVVIKKPKAVKAPLPGDTLRNAWLGIEPEEEYDPDNTLARAWHGTDYQQPEEDTLKNAWLGRTPHGSRTVRTRKGDISIRDYRTASRGDENSFKSQGAVGVYVVKDGKILTGIRGHGDGEHLICGPGGHIEKGETPGQAAIRETQEEFGITPMELIPFGRGDKEPNGLQPYLFLCVRYEGTPKCDEVEMHQARFTAIEEIENSGRLFPAFEAGCRKLMKKISQSEPHMDDDDWVTIKGTHVLLNEEGVAQSGGKLAGKTFSHAKSQKKSPVAAKSTGKPSLSDAMKPVGTDYNTTLNDDYNDFLRKNAGNKKKPTALYNMYRQVEEEGGDGFEACRDEYHKTRLAMCTEGLKEVSRDEADEILSDNLNHGTLQQWFQEYNHNVKDGLVWQMTQNPEVHNAALNVMYQNYKYSCVENGEEPLPFEEFLVTPVKMYRGGTGKEYETAGVFSSYTFNRKAAESFTGSEVGQGHAYDPNGVIYEAEIRPIDTYGSVYTNGESEILVPRMIAPNGNRDSAEEDI